jgi:hypothetical protein
MHRYLYLRAYMAGIVIPTAFLVVALTALCIARFVYQIPVPIERVIVFPMALIPNIFGVWNVLRLVLRTRFLLPLGIHGAILPLLLVPAGLVVARTLGILHPTADGLVYFQAVKVSYAHLGFMIPVLVVIYYLVWKYAIGFLNGVVGVNQ